MPSSDCVLLAALAAWLLPIWAFCQFVLAGQALHEILQGKPSVYAHFVEYIYFIGTFPDLLLALAMPASVWKELCSL